MTSKKFTLIPGGRDALEASLIEALFKPDTAEINRISTPLQNHRKGRSRDSAVDAMQAVSF